MDISLHPQIFALAPGFTRYVLHVTDAVNQTQNTVLQTLLQQQEQAVRAAEEYADLANHPRLSAWRTLFTAFQVNPNRCPPSICNLIKRTRSGKDLPFINSLVCIFNILSLEYCIPAGGDDLAAITGNICLMPAQGTETYVPLGSKTPDAIEHPATGEIVLLDTGSNNVLCRAWCWKNADTSKIQPSTSDVAINLDILPPVSAEEGAIIAQKASQLITEHCNGQVTIHKLDAHTPVISI